MTIEKSVSTCLVSVAALVAASDSVAAQDWSGFYAGLSYGMSGGTSPIQPYVYDEGYQVDGNAVGGFAGFRWNAGESLVMGVEVAMQGKIDVVPDEGNSSDPYTLDNLVDAKLSIGTPVGKALVYGFGGLSSAGLTGGDDDYSGPSGASGMNFGVGVDYMVSDQFSIGAEYISRNMVGYTSGGNPDGPTNLDTVSLRASFKF